MAAQTANALSPFASFFLVVLFLVVVFFVVIASRSGVHAETTFGRCLGVLLLLFQFTGGFFGQRLSSDGAFFIVFLFNSAMGHLRLRATRCGSHYVILTFGS